MEARQMPSNTRMQSNSKFQMNIVTQDMGKPIANIHHKSIRNRILDAIFGRQNRVLIIVPESCVDHITFTEEDGGKEVLAGF